MPDGLAYTVPTENLKQRNLDYIGAKDALLRTASDKNTAINETFQLIGSRS